MNTQRLSTGMRRANACLMAAAGLGLFLLPAVILVRDLADPALRRPEGLPRVAWRVHASLSPRYAKWARSRVDSKAAAQAPLYDVMATEWAMFGSVFYLSATENLQREWERLPGRPPATAPAVYARDAIEAAVDLVLDPVHHTWVRQHWGPNYMNRENVFFRAMLIQALMARENLVRDRRDILLLRHLVDTLAADLDQSPHGLLNDYPGECYPIDVFAAVALIRRADALLGTDHAAFAERERRAFSGRLVDETGLPGYLALPETGVLDYDSRGIGNSYVLIYCPELYPDWTADWYGKYKKHFWQQRIGAAGFREYARTVPKSELFHFDVDAGPVIAGFGPAANAFGVAAARANGRFDDAWTLSSQVLAAAWPLPDGGWLGARFLSSATDAPYLGEANLLFLFTTKPAPGVPIRTGGFVPPLVYGLLGFYIGMGLLMLVAALRQWRHAPALPVPGAILVQARLWGALVVAGLILWLFGQGSATVLSMALAQFLPRAK